MLREFWELRKHQIQFVSILTAVGALFLSITPPENEIAQKALANIQFIWLLIISISVIVLFINLWKLAGRIEEHTKEKYDFDLDETISLIISLTALWVLLNLWQYTFILYKESLESFMAITTFSIGAIIMTLSIAVFNRIQNKLKDKVPNEFIRMAIFFMVVSLMIGFWTNILDLKISLEKTAKSFLMVFPGLYIFGLVLHFLPRITGKKQE